MLTAEQSAALQGAVVRLATLVEMRFVSRTVRLWNGAGILDAAGQEWQGLGQAGAIDGLPQSRSLTADKVTFSLSAVDPEVAAVAAAGRADVEGRDVLVWFQLLDETWQPLGAPIAAWWGIMRRPTFSRTPHGADGAGGAMRVVAIEAENPYVGRARPASGRFTDRDQQARQPGDRICRFVSNQRSKAVTWPVFPP